MVETIENKQDREAMAADEMKRASDELRSARVLYDNKLYFKSASSAYYAVYHSAKALLLLKGIAPKSHEGVERMFALHYIKSGEIEIQIGKTIGRLMKMREEADYYPEVPFEKNEALSAIKMAAAFVRAVRERISRLLKK